MSAATSSPASTFVTDPASLPSARNRAPLAQRRASFREVDVPSPGSRQLGSYRSAFDVDAFAASIVESGQQERELDNELVALDDAFAGLANGG